MSDIKVTVNRQTPVVKVTEPSAGTVSKVNLTDLTSTVTGKQGSTGFQGSTGWTGASGYVGQDGATGFRGATGFTEY